MKEEQMQDNRNGQEGNEENDGLYAALTRYCEGDHYPYHMPGHKRNREAGPMASYYGIDITEIDGFDDLHHAEGILQEAQERANKLYGGRGTETFYLINGSTCGVLASIMAAAQRGEKILAARNCHRSVYHAAILQELELQYCFVPVIEEYGICGGINAKEIDRLLKQHADCRAVVITSPTYEGLISDVGAAADVVHAHDKILIVDEAHGAHLGLDESAPHGAVACGADLVIHSLHKTLPAMTQTALLHVQGNRVDRDRLRRYLRMLQTSSPSYVLMASMDSCIRYVESHGAERYAFMRQQYDIFCEKIRKCKHIWIGGITCETTAGNSQNRADGAERSRTAEAYYAAGWDIGKLLIYTRDGSLCGRQLYDLLREEYHLQMEMAAEKYVLAIMTIMDTEEGWQRLAAALRQIDDRIETGAMIGPGKIPGEESGMERKEAAGIADESVVQYGKENAGGKKSTDVTMAQAYLGKREPISLAECVGKVAADFVHLYPPGIPLISPGEVVGEEMVERIGKYRSLGLQVQGVTADGKIMILQCIV